MNVGGDSMMRLLSAACLADDLGALRDDIVPLRRLVRDAGDDFRRLDQAWDRALKVERRALSVMGKLERAEALSFGR